MCIIQGFQKGLSTMQEIVQFMQHHEMLSLALIIIFILLIIIEFVRLKRGSNQISPNQLISMINHQNAVVVDIRAPDAFASGHIVDAISLPLADIDGKHKKLEKFKSHPIVIVCTAGVESQKAAAQLEKNGFNALILAGGIRAWRTAEMPLVKG